MSESKNNECDYCDLTTKQDNEEPDKDEDLEEEPETNDGKNILNMEMPILEFPKFEAPSFELPNF